jgi:hypothetical protein
VSRQTQYVLGTLVGVAAQYFLLYPSPFDGHMSNSASFSFWTAPVRGLEVIVPGLLVGLIAARHGILLGALAVWLAEVARHIVWASTSGDFAVSAGQHAGGADYLYFAGTIAWLSLSNAFVGAASGGLGELLRSNKSLEQTRDR